MATYQDASLFQVLEALRIWEARARGQSEDHEKALQQIIHLLEDIRDTLDAERERSRGGD